MSELIPVLRQADKYTQRIHWRHSDPHSHDYWEWVFVTHGTAHHFCNGVSRDIDCGQLMLVRPTDVHGYLGDEESAKNNTIEPGYEHRDLFVPAALLRRTVDFFGAQDLLDALTAPKHPVVLTLTEEQRSELETQLDILETYDGKNKPAFDRILKALVCQIFGLCARQKDFGSENSPAWLRRLILKMHESGLIGGSLDDVVRVSGFSHGHLCRIFKKYTGQCLIDYYRRLKMQYAANLLINGNASVSEIASAVGYDSPANFIIQFRKFSGMTPHAYRKSRTSPHIRPL